MTYSIAVVVTDGKAEVETSGEVPDGHYEIAGNPDAHGPNPGVRFTRHENRPSSGARPPGGREG